MRSFCSGVTLLDHDTIAVEQVAQHRVVVRQVVAGDHDSVVAEQPDLGRNRSAASLAVSPERQPADTSVIDPLRRISPDHRRRSHPGTNQLRRQPAQSFGELLKQQSGHQHPDRRCHNHRPRAVAADESHRAHHRGSEAASQDDSTRDGEQPVVRECLRRFHTEREADREKNRPAQD